MVLILSFKFSMSCPQSLLSVCLEGHCPDSSIVLQPRITFSSFSTPILPSVNVVSASLARYVILRIDVMQSRRRFFADVASWINASACVRESDGCRLDSFLHGGIVVISAFLYVVACSISSCRIFMPFEDVVWLLLFVGAGVHIV